MTGRRPAAKAVDALGAGVDTDVAEKADEGVVGVAGVEGEGAGAGGVRVAAAECIGAGGETEGI